MTIAIGLVVGTGGAADTPRPDPAFRRPVALVFCGHRLLVGNRDSGSLSVIDRRSGQLVDHWPAGGGIRDICLLPGGRQVAIADASGPSIRVLSTDDGRPVAARPLPVEAVQLRVRPDGAYLGAALLWARQLYLFPLPGRPETAPLDQPRIVDLPFAPRCLLWLPGHGRLLVADAFQGKLAVVDPEQAKVVVSRSIDGHNISALAYDPHQDAVLIAHQKLLANVPTTRDRIFWGQVISSLLRSVQVDHLLEGTVDGYPPIGRWTVEPLGRSGQGGSDPAGMAVDASGRRIICLAGVDQLAISAQAGDPFRRVDVGDHPVAVLVDDAAGLAYVANRLDDSISIVDLSQSVAVATLPLGPTPPPDAVRRGERLFFDARLSLDGWMSCNSCHPDGHTNGLLNDNFGDDMEGTPKRVLSLLGTGQTGPWSWLGRRKSLEEQIAKSMQTTMRGTPPLESDSTEVADLAAYLHSLQPPPSVPQARGELDPIDVQRGRQLFGQLQCAECHAPQSAFTSADTYAVGLHDEAGNEWFNPPSLRGVDQRLAWLHDGRAQTLHEVFTRFGHPNESTRGLTADQVDWLVAYLQSL